jgi:hypothetical protein
MGRLFDRERAYEKAIAAYEKSLQINSGDLNTQRRFVELITRIDPASGESERLRLKQLLSFYLGD